MTCKPSENNTSYFITEASSDGPWQRRDASALPSSVTSGSGSEERGLFGKPGAEWTEALPTAQGSAAAPPKTLSSQTSGAAHHGSLSLPPRGSVLGNSFPAPCDISSVAASLGTMEPCQDCHLSLGPGRMCISFMTESPSSWAEWKLLKKGQKISPSDAPLSGSC